MGDLLALVAWIGAILGVLLGLIAFFIWRALWAIDFWDEKSFQLERDFCTCLGASAASFLVALLCAKLASVY